MNRCKKGLIRVNILLVMKKLNKPVQSKEIAEALTKEIGYPVTSRRIGNLINDLVIKGVILKYKTKIKYPKHKNKLFTSSAYTYELNNGVINVLDE